MSDVVVGVDLGGTKIAAAPVEPGGGVGTVRQLPTPARRGPAAVLDAVAALITQVAGPTSEASGRVRGIGIGTAGVVHAGNGRILSATDALSGWAGTDVRSGIHSRVQDAFGAVPVTVENDVDAHAAGEAWRGAAAGARSALLVAIGTGVGAALVLEGQPLRGAHHVAGEMGHLPSPEAAGLRCGCGRTGHLEAIASGPALHRQYLRLGGPADVPDAREVYQRAAAGEGLARQVLSTAATAAGRAIAGVSMILDPETVVVSGGLGQAGEWWWEPMIRAARDELIEPLADLDIRAAALGSRAAILGAARTCWDVLGAGGIEVGSSPS
ncbi:MAG TPA: ROK family protein [Beutenbergiaceae bacterium]|nr:ROK family protein [Beutenbergiaceae bacterium]